MKTVSMSIRFPSNQHAAIKQAVDGIVFRSINQLVIVAVDRLLRHGDYPSTYTSNTSNVDPKTPVASTNVDTPTPLDVSTPKPKGLAKYTTDFLDFWSLYPRSKEKRAAFRAWAAAIKMGVTRGEIMSGLSWCIDTPEKLGGFPGELKFVPYPARWLKNGGYEVDEGSRAKKESVSMSDGWDDLSWVFEKGSCGIKEELSSSLRGAIGAYAYNDWIAPSLWVTGVDGALFVVCPDEAHTQWVKSHYLSHITECVEESPGISIALVDCVEVSVAVKQGVV
jgi:hypothetical protein